MVEYSASRVSYVIISWYTLQKWTHVLKIKQQREKRSPFLLLFPFDVNIVHPVFIFPNMTFGLLRRTLLSWQRPESACISNCNCYTASVSPVCGSNGVTYLSACFAGCTKPVSVDINADSNTGELKLRDKYRYTQCSNPVRSPYSLWFLVSVSEPDQLYVYIQHQRGCGGSTREVPQSRLSAGLPHLPLCYLCVQHDRSHGPDTLRHHPYQVRRPAAIHRLPTRGSCWHLIL